MVKCGGGMDADAGCWLSLGRKSAWAEEEKNQTNKKEKKKTRKKKTEKADGTSCKIPLENETLRNQGLEFNTVVF